VASVGFCGLGLKKAYNDDPMQESEIRRYHRKCGCISLYTFDPNKTIEKADIFDIQLCELHKSQIIDEYEA
jgi:hypothetical protein